MIPAWVKKHVIAKNDLVPWALFTMAKVYGEKIKHANFVELINIELEFCECAIPDDPFASEFNQYVVNWLLNKDCDFVRDLRAPVVESKLNEYPARLCYLAIALLDEQSCFEPVINSFRELASRYASNLRTVDAKAKLRQTALAFKTYQDRLEI